MQEWCKTAVYPKKQIAEMMFNVRTQFSSRREYKYTRKLEHFNNVVIKIFTFDLNFTFFIIFLEAYLPIKSLEC